MATHGDPVGHQAADANLDLRDYSPPPSLSPTPAISSCPSPERTFSTVSSLSNGSGDASSSVSTSTSTKRRGYIRPQGTAFAESARNRESVMSLGSITHLQYYFARTGLLDGKGAQLARAKKDGSGGTGNNGDGSDKLAPSPSLQAQTQTQTQTQLGDELSESPVDEGIDTSGEWDDDGMMLPPTVSTYSIPTYHLPPPPDLASLREDLEKALERAQKVVSTTGQQLATNVRVSKPKNAPEELSPATASEPPPEPQQKKPMQGLHELEGMHVLDVVTLAIRAAKIYYTSHEHPERLATIKSDRKLREELLAVLDVLKRSASRNFAGGLRDEERNAISGWIAGVGDMLAQEKRIEDIEKHKRATWIWTNGDWSGKEREREEAFIRSLETTNNPLPAWTPPTSTELPTEFLARLRDGRDLVRFHNEAVRLSRRHFGEIKSYHQDVLKPYRLADNLRYWVKAAEIRWEIVLDVDVMGVVNGNSDDAWIKFDSALLKWCRGVREELSREWLEKAQTPVLNIPPPEEAV